MQLGVPHKNQDYDIAKKYFMYVGGFNMGDLLSGLDSLGLGNLEDMNLFDKTLDGAKDGNPEKNVKPKITEEDFLFDKGYKCPICDNDISAKTVKVGKAKLIGTDLDLRPKYSGVDPLKYDVVACPHCGYAALTRYFQYMTDGQFKAVKAKICANFKPQSNDQRAVYTYDEALERYKLALANAIVKQTKASEKAYIYLKTGWLLRSKGESLNKDDADYAQQYAANEKEERSFLQNAMEGFINARQTESFPMCGMDESTVDYLIAVLATEFEKYDIASKLIGNLITSKTTNPRMKEKSRDLKDIVLKKMKEKGLV